MTSANDLAGDELLDLDEVARLLIDPDTFERLVDRLPDPRMICALKVWGAWWGLYPVEKAERAAILLPGVMDNSGPAPASH
jgi:hypothetical protein